MRFQPDHRAALAGAIVLLLSLVGGSALAQSPAGVAVTMAGAAAPATRYPWPVIRVTGWATGELTGSLGAAPTVNLLFSVTAKGSSASAALSSALGRLTRLVRALRSIPQTTVIAVSVSPQSVSYFRQLAKDATVIAANVSPRSGPVVPVPSLPPGMAPHGSTGAAGTSGFEAAAAVQAPLAEAGKAIAAASAQGVTGFNAVVAQGGVASPIPSGLLDPALAQAYARASLEARRLARAMGVTLGPVESAVVDPVQACVKCQGPAATFTVEVRVVYRIG